MRSSTSGTAKWIRHGYGDRRSATLRPDRVIGFHYFYPASVMPLIEIVEGEDTSAETTTAAVTFAQAIRKQPITCAEVPGFVVNRILNSGTSEVWREQARSRPCGVRHTNSWSIASAVWSHAQPPR